MDKERTSSIPSSEIQKIIAIVPAAGSGTRMGMSVRKQFIEIDGVSILEMTVDALLDAGVDHIFLILPSTENVPEFANSEFITAVKGGADRLESVKNGLDRAVKLFGGDCIVLVHDGVRPFVNKKLISRVASLVKEGVGVVPTLKLVDTIRVIDESEGSDGQVFASDLSQGATRLTANVSAVDSPEPIHLGQVIDRNSLRLCQTPQGFLLKDLAMAYRRLFEDSIEQANGTGDFEDNPNGTDDFKYNANGTDDFKYNANGADDYEYTKNNLVTKKNIHLSSLRQHLTDDASVFQLFGGRIVSTDGIRENIKITTVDDLAFVQAIKKNRGAW